MLLPLEDSTATQCCLHCLRPSSFNKTVKLFQEASMESTHIFTFFWITSLAFSPADNIVVWLWNPQGISKEPMRDTLIELQVWHSYLMESCSCKIDDLQYNYITGCQFSDNYFSRADFFGHQLPDLAR